MTTIFTAQLQCDCACARRAHHGCLVSYPDRPKESAARDLRVRARGAGWQVQRGTKGDDVCPPCRIAAIRDASGGALADASGGALADPSVDAG